MAGNGAAANIEGFIYVAMNAFHHVALTFTSQNLGAHNLARIKRVALACVLIVTVVGLVIGLGALAAGEALLSIYDKDPAVIAYGMGRMTIICMTYFLCGIMDVMGGLMRGLGYSIAPMMVSLIGACAFRVMWIYTFFAWNPTLTCLYTSYPISWALTAAAHAVCFIIAMRQMKRKLMPAQ
jgi:Na+-driven multidrug efflux pump